MAVKLHRCSLTWAKIGPHPCWKAQKDGRTYRAESAEMAERIRAGKLFDA